MTTKIKVAMFALAAVAALSLGMAPMQEAFASSQGTQYLSTTAPTQYNTNSDQDSKVICGQTVNAGLQVKNNDPTDQIEVFYNISHCQTWEKVVFAVTVGSGPVDYTFTEYNNAQGAQIFPHTFGSSGGETVVATITYFW